MSALTVAGFVILLIGLILAFTWERTVGVGLLIIGAVLTIVGLLIGADGVTVGI